MKFRIKVREFERGLKFYDGEFVEILGPGKYWVIDPKVRIDVVSTREAAFNHAELDVIVKLGALKDEAIVADLATDQRALVWIDGRFEGILGDGLHVFWTVFHDVKIDVHEVEELRFEHKLMPVILGTVSAHVALESHVIHAGSVGLLYVDGKFVEVLKPGQHVFWRKAGNIRVMVEELREQVLDVVGQDIMTADRVTLRLNAVVTYRVVDPVKAMSEVKDPAQALYREAQLALRSIVGKRELDELLAEKDGAASTLNELVRERGKAIGIDVLDVGIRDIILPGEMKTLLNKVVEARKAAEANLITRREETATMRNQANTAKIFESNPTLMRLRELEVLEKIADKTNLTVVLGENGLTDRVTKLI